jgi:argininosuccinate lyase
VSDEKWTEALRVATEALHRIDTHEQVCLVLHRANSVTLANIEAQLGAGQEWRWRAAYSVIAVLVAIIGGLSSKLMGAF